MFLRNYDNYFVAINLCEYPNPSYPAAGSSTSISSTSEFADGAYVQKATNGSTYSALFVTTLGSTGFSKPALMFNVNGICLGTGNTAVTYDDYRLSGDIIENKLAQVSSTKTYNSQTHKWKWTLVASYTNQGDADITISEWGLWRNNNDYSTVKFSHTSSACCLVFREVLDEPIVIEPGTTATLSFSIEIPMPNHP